SRPDCRNRGGIGQGRQGSTRATLQDDVHDAAPAAVLGIQCTDRVGGLQRNQYRIESLVQEPAGSAVVDRYYAVYGQQLIADADFCIFIERIEDLSIIAKNTRWHITQQSLQRRAIQRHLQDLRSL